MKGSYVLGGLGDQGMLPNHPGISSAYIRVERLI